MNTYNITNKYLGSEVNNSKIPILMYEKKTSPSTKEEDVLKMKLKHHHLNLKNKKFAFKMKGNKKTTT